VSVQRKMAHGAVWMLLFTFFERGLGLISTLLLVRLLAPGDFGVVAMATSFIFMAELLARFGFDVALIQRQDATVDDYNTAWTCNVLFGACITLAMLAGAAAIADFYNHPELFWIVCALAPGSLITGLENIGVVAFRKDMEFGREFRFQLSRKIIGFLVVVPMAFALRSYWALIAGTLAARLAGTITSYLIHPFRPRLSLVTARSLMNFSKWMLLNNFVSFFKERSSDFFVGRMLGATPLGLYNISYEIGSMPTTELSAPINRALLPGFARIAHDPVAMRAAYRNAIGALALLAVPAAAGLFAVAPFLVPVILGPKWLGAVPLMEILALNGGILLFHSSICAVVIAGGRPDRVSTTNLMYVVMLLMLLAVVVPVWGVIGVAWAAIATSVLATPIYLLQVRRSLGIPPAEFVRAAARPAMASALMALAVRWLLPDWTASMTLLHSVGWLLGGVASGAVVYAAMVGILWLANGRPEGMEKVLLAKVRLRLAGTPGEPATTIP
jgi:lipopolysaccharide exporter